MCYIIVYIIYIIVYYGIILETLGPGGARVAFVNTIEETANAILSGASFIRCACHELMGRCQIDVEVLEKISMLDMK